MIMYKCFCVLEVGLKECFGLVRWLLVMRIILFYGFMGVRWVLNGCKRI